jgi:PmbA protein
MTVIDDPLINNAPGSRPFDDEGSVSKRTEIFSDGFFKTFLFDRETGSKTGNISTGNAQRKLLSAPVIGISNLVFSAGDTTLENMISGIGKGVIVYGALGGGQSNLIAGDFALNLMLGFLIENGEIKGRLNNTMISGNIYDAFNSIALMGKEVKQTGSLYIPDILFNNIDVSSV